MSQVQHSGRAHARLNASSSHRWMACPPSVKLSEQFADTTSQYAEEGTYLHELCELNARVVQDQAVYNERYNELTERYNAAHAEAVRLTEAKADRQGRLLKLTAFLETLRDRDTLVTEFNDGLWNAVVQDVTVRADGGMTFRLRDDSEMEYEA